MRRLTGLTALAVVSTLAFFATATPAGARPVKIEFEQDPMGEVPNGFTSVDSLVVHFTDSAGADLQINDYGGQSRGQALAVYDDDPSYLIMDFDIPMCTLSLAFGNDDPEFSEPGDRAILTLYQDGSAVGRVAVVMNRNDIMDQRASYFGQQFDQATFFYDVGSDAFEGLIELVDNIRYVPC